jgi:exosortase
MKFSSLPISSRWAAFAAATLSLFLIWDQHYWWKLQDEYAFGFIVPLFVAYVLYERWPAYVLYERWPDLAKGLIGDPEASAKATSAESGLARAIALGLQVIAVLMVVGGILSFLLGVLYRAMVLGGAYLYADKRANGEGIPIGERWHLAMLFLFPALIWMLSVPMFNAIHKMISTFLMNKVAFVVYYAFDVLGYAVVREGSVLKLPLGDVGVEDACSGIRSLTACLFAGSFLGAVYFQQLWKKIFLVGTAMLFAFINNIFRSLFLTAWAYAHGPGGLDDHVVLLGMDMGNVHDFTGWVVLGMTVVCLLILVKLFSIQLEYKIPEEETL